MSPAMALNEQKRKDDTAEGKSEYLKGVKHLCEKGHIRAVPKKYILPVADRPTKSAEEDSNALNQNLHLPIIDFAELLGPNRPQALQSLANACQQYGFFQVKCFLHGLMMHEQRTLNIQRTNLKGNHFREEYQQ